jgi:hypothetical protein
MPLSFLKAEFSQHGVMLVTWPDPGREYSAKQGILASR